MNDQDEVDIFVEDIGRPAPAEPVAAGGLTSGAYVIGSAGLLGATAIDATAVAARHLGFPILGSIELVQVAAVLTATGAMIVATGVGAHASVHILTQRLSQSVRSLLGRCADGLGAVLFVLFLAGSIWVAAAMWDGFERTEILTIDLRWFRALWIIGACLIAFLFVRRSFGDRK